MVVNLIWQRDDKFLGFKNGGHLRNKIDDEVENRWCEFSEGKMYDMLVDDILIRTCNFQDLFFSLFISLWL